MAERNPAPRSHAVSRRASFHRTSVMTTPTANAVRPSSRGLESCWGHARAPAGSFTRPILCRSIFIFLGVSARDLRAQMQRGRLVSRSGLDATPMCCEVAAYAEPFFSTGASAHAW